MRDLEPLTYALGVRPAGIVERIQELRRAEQESVAAELRLRWSLVELVDDCARLRCADLDVTDLARTWIDTDSLLTDPAQRLTGTALERDSLLLVENLRPAAVAFLALEDPDWDEREATLGQPAGRWSAAVIAGGESPGATWTMARRNALGAWEEGVISAYRAVSLLAAAAYHARDRDVDLVAETAALRMRFEDEPAERAAIEAEMVAVLTRWKGLAEL